MLTVWGSGTQMRDFIHIDDCVAGVIATMDKIDDGNAVESIDRHLYQLHRICAFSGQAMRLFTGSSGNV